MSRRTRVAASTPGTVPATVSAGLAAAALVLALPRLAWACPTCATREGSGWGLLVALGAMILVPYLVALVTIRAIRRLERGR